MVTVLVVVGAVGGVELCGDITTCSVCEGYEEVLSRESRMRAMSYPIDVNISLYEALKIRHKSLGLNQ